MHVSYVKKNPMKFPVKLVSMKILGIPDDSFRCRIDENIDGNIEFL